MHVQHRTCSSSLVATGFFPTRQGVVRAYVFSFTAYRGG
jgi:hypothetical protein